MGALCFSITNRNFNIFFEQSVSFSSPKSETSLMLILFVNVYKDTHWERLQE